MWARVVEIMLGCWLAMSPFIFRHDPEVWALWANDWIVATLIMTFSTLSYWSKTPHLHLLNAALALWLIGFGRFSSLPPSTVSPPYQNEIVVGMLLAMFAIVPNWSFEPPSIWWSDPDEIGAGD